MFGNRFEKFLSLNRWDALAALIAILAGSAAFAQSAPSPKIATASASGALSYMTVIGLAFFAMAASAFFLWRYLSVRKKQRTAQTLNRGLAAKNAELIASNIQLEKENQAKMEFLATTSHEVRTPLNAIIGLTDVVLTADKLSDNDRDNLEVFNTSGKNLMRILDDILDISKLEAGKLRIDLQSMDISECVLDVAELWRNTAREKGLSYKVGVDKRIGNVFCDERLIRQIISNLVSNAVKFTDKGEVNIQLKAVESGFIIAVRDTGIGIAPDQQTLIFEPFRQAERDNERRFNGTGLGLAISNKITEALGGKISVSSKPGEGALFTVNIPAEKCKMTGVGASMQPGQAEGNNSALPPNGQELSVLRILLTEDNPANALVICAMLSGQAKIDVAENGAEAVRAIQENSYDVVLMDKQMPKMDGIIATREIRALPSPYRDTPIIGLTAGVLSDVKKECLDSGMDEFLTKPVPFVRLKATIMNAIKARRTVAA